MHLLQTPELGEVLNASSTIPDKALYAKYKSIIPKGIYYESAKKRWRVRLYKTGSVVFLGYYKDFTASLSAWETAKGIQQLATSKKLEQLDLKTENTEDLITTLSIL